MEHWRKGNPCHKVAKNMTKLYSYCCVLCKPELVTDEIGYLAEEIFKQSIEGVAWLLLTAYSKIWEEKNDLKMELSSEKEPECKIWKTLGLYCKEWIRVFWRDCKGCSQKTIWRLVREARNNAREVLKAIQRSLELPSHCGPRVQRSGWPWIQRTNTCRTAVSDHHCLTSSRDPLPSPISGVAPRGLCCIGHGGCTEDRAGSKLWPERPRAISSSTLSALGEYYGPHPGRFQQMGLPDRAMNSRCMPTAF